MIAPEKPPLRIAKRTCSTVSVRKLKFGPFVLRGSRSPSRSPGRPPPSGCGSRRSGRGTAPRRCSTGSTRRPRSPGAAAGQRGGAGEQHDHRADYALMRREYIAPGPDAVQHRHRGDLDRGFAPSARACLPRIRSADSEAMRGAGRSQREEHDDQGRQRHDADLAANDRALRRHAARPPAACRQPACLPARADRGSSRRRRTRSCSATNAIASGSRA